MQIFKDFSYGVSEKIAFDLQQDNQIKKVDIINPGFINIFFYNSFWQKQLVSI